MITIDIKDNNDEIIGNASFKLKEAKNINNVTKDEIFLFEGKICMKDEFYANTTAHDLFTNEKIDISTFLGSIVCFTLELVEG